MPASESSLRLYVQMCKVGVLNLVPCYDQTPIVLLVVFEQRVALRMDAQKNMHLKEIKLHAYLKILGLIVDIIEGAYITI